MHVLATNVCVWIRTLSRQSLEDSVRDGWTLEQLKANQIAAAANTTPETLSESLSQSVWFLKLVRRTNIIQIIPRTELNFHYILDYFFWFQHSGAVHLLERSLGYTVPSHISTHVCYSMQS